MSMILRGHAKNRLIHTIGYLSLFVLLCLFLAACGGEDSSPEQQIRQFIAEAESAVEARSIKRIQELIAENYSDQARRKRGDLVRLMGGYFFRHKSIHLFTRIADLQIKDENRAEVVLYVAMAGTPISAAEQVLSLRADLHRFELELAKGEGGQWQLQSARWRRTNPEEFIQGS